MGRARRAAVGITVYACPRCVVRYVRGRAFDDRAPPDWLSSDEVRQQLPLARWRIRRAERRCRALEDSLWTSAPESVRVPTRFGSTQAYRWPGSGVPLVLLHGGAVTSLTWEPI